MARPLLTLAVVVFGLFASPAAWAQAPMCDQSGATVMAPLPAPPSEDGEIAFIACPSHLDLGEKVGPGLPNPAPERQLPLHDDLALLPLLFPATASPSVIGIFAEPVWSDGPLGYHSEVFRPPRARREL